MKCLDPLSAMMKKLALFLVPFWKKSGKKCKKVQILLDLFDSEVSFFQERSIEISSSFFFALQSVHQDASFELSNSTI